MVKAARKNSETEPTTAAPEPQEKPAFSLISQEKLLALYANLLKCRLLAERAGAAARGWEASVVGVVQDLLPEDTLAIAEDNPLPALVKGAPLEFFFSQGAMQAEEQSTQAIRGFAALNLIASGSGAAINFAAGVALANKIQSNGRVTVAFCGSGQEAFEQWSEVFSFTGSQDLPMIFVLRNGNTDKLATQAERWQIPSMPVDGSDVVAVYRVAFESIARARLGRGPTIIDCRIDAAWNPAHSTEPIRNMETYLSRKGFFSAAIQQEVLAKFAKELDAAAQAAGKDAPAWENYPLRERALNRKPWKLKF